MSTALKIVTGFCLTALCVVVYGSIDGVVTMDILEQETEKLAPNGKPYYGPAF